MEEKLTKMNAEKYKKYHESFMENNNGTSALHVFFCIFFTIQCAIFCSIRVKKPRINPYIFEYILIVLPLITAHTILTDCIHLWNIIIFSMILYEIKEQPLMLNVKFKSRNFYSDNKLKSITVMRGLTYLITVFCILAVDFKDFPRYLAKTEKFGYSLMDTGVGLFVMMSGLTHRNLSNNNIKKVISGNLNLMIILVILGFTRYISVKQLNYQEHVTEYGVHWNFYYTLAVCKLISTIILFSSNHTLLLSFITLALHEFILYGGLQDWVFSNMSRDSLLSANREGISSCLGYVSMYLFAAHLKTILCDKMVYKYTVQIKLVLGSIFLWTFLYLINHFRPISRVLANAGYCVYLASILVTVVMVLYFFETVLNFSVPSTIFVINSNGLWFFIVANLATGAINLSMRTLLASSVITFIILNIYMISTLAVTVYSFRKGLRL